MVNLIYGVTATVCAALWLLLLELTDFNAATISIGLLAAIYVTGGNAGPHR